MFWETESKQVKLQMDIHTKGKGVVGQYTMWWYRNKQAMVQAFAQVQEQHPLKIEIEQDD